MPTVATPAPEPQNIADAIKGIFQMLKTAETAGQGSSFRRTFATKGSAFLISSAVYLLAGFALALLYSSFHQNDKKIVPAIVASLFVAIIFLFLSFAVDLVEIFIKMKKRVSESLPSGIEIAGVPWLQRIQFDEIDSVSKRSSTDFNLLQNLSNFPLEALKYAANRFHLKCEHYRFRIGTVFGALDKIGYLPLVVGSLFQLFQLHITKGVPFREWMFPLTGGVILYTGLGRAFHEVAIRLDELAQILDLAINQKDDSANNRKS